MSEDYSDIESRIQPFEDKPLTPHDLLVRNITTAMEADDVQPLIDSLRDVARKLTGMTEFRGGHLNNRDVPLLTRIIRTYVEDAKKLRNTMSEEIYIDGVSRFILTSENGKPSVMLSGVSAERVKRKWEELNAQTPSSHDE